MSVHIELENDNVQKYEVWTFGGGTICALVSCVVI